ncbi:hypothetical protein LEMA_P124440.1 [Plenodomus lingam JN3]|uniref:Uncharacterized protein n=1 Tax=Leptosphaeria maculans (strain JN3 / isolate v23.1.3 / race Av1-4-5-6-7-8) TaxID=985895 RepID=E4ZQ44_LEPMJ|nr:hypothetical protein LEMA_P124440.1 [Plenodomus lingam JN3]CBX89954.1 hypothetical protein LEMA_P124440.1 [Plenodomus lingam JN3]
MLVSKPDAATCGEQNHCGLYYIVLLVAMFDRIDLDECHSKFSANTSLHELWGWRGLTVGFAHNYSTLISREGCKAVCGTGTEYYSWNDVSSTITTWILPVIGTLLQAPFESNAARRTLLAIARWVGSPIASLSYVLWNIKVSAKAAVMVDMAVKYDQTPDRRTDFGSMRDSMYLLLVMNQYSIKSTAALSGKEAEGLLRIVLFSKDLKLTDTDKTLRQMRRILARELRDMRRRGVVPVFVSILWFVFAFALSIQAAFGDLGGNTTAHDLALGCLLAWFPILIMGSIVDRNPIAAEAIRKKLNAIVDHVRHALRDNEHRKEFINTFQDQDDFEQLRSWVNKVTSKGEHMDDFFVEFAGQARIRWHYGVAHPILSDIENCYIAEKGRNWLAKEQEARSKLVLGPVNDEGLIWFDVREFWQVMSAIIIVGGSCGGAFVISYFTPTVGLGCRSGGYTIFFSVALGLLIMEMAVWLALSPYHVEAQWLRHTGTRLHTIDTFNRLEDDAHNRWRTFKRRVSGLVTTTKRGLLRLVVRMAMSIPCGNMKARKQRVESAITDFFVDICSMSPQRKWGVFFFRPAEGFSTIWLIYIVLAQVFGVYTTCDCLTSNWAGGGGYLDFVVQDTSNPKWVLWYWTAGTQLTALVMIFSMFYITVEWCQQSFLSTEDYEDAMDGLRMTRKYRHWTYIFRLLSRLLSSITLTPLEKLAISIGLVRKPQKTLLWTKDHSWSPEVPLAHSEPAVATSYASPSPSFELTDKSGVAARDGTQVAKTPAMAHSLFRSAFTTWPRNESDASIQPISIHAQHQASGESHQPLIRRPTEAHHTRGEMGSRSSGDGRVSLEDSYLSASPPERSSLLGPNVALHSRQGYRRASSDPGMPPSDLMDTSQNAREIGVQDVDLESGIPVHEEVDNTTVWQAARWSAPEILKTPGKVPGISIMFS